MWHIHVEFSENFEGGLWGCGMSRPLPREPMVAVTFSHCQNKKAAFGREKTPQNRAKTTHKCAQSVRRGHGLDFDPPYPLPVCYVLFRLCYAPLPPGPGDSPCGLRPENQTGLLKIDRTGTFSHAKRKIQGQVTPLVNPHRIGL